jgi:hypothetical protein
LSPPLKVFDPVNVCVPVNLLPPVKVLASPNKVEDAALGVEVSIYTRPVAFVFNVPTVEVARVINPTFKFVVDAVTNEEYTVDDE